MNVRTGETAEKLLCSSKGLLARPKRFELLTPRFVVWCSIQLSYGRVSDFSRLPHSADERAVFRLSTRRPGDDFSYFAGNDIAGAEAQGKRRSPLGRRPAFRAQPASERSARLPCPVGRGRRSCLQISVVVVAAFPLLQDFLHVRLHRISTTRVAKVVLCPQPSLVRALLASPRRESTSVGRK